MISPCYRFALHLLFLMMDCLSHFHIFSFGYFLPLSPSPRILHPQTTQFYAMKIEKSHLDWPN